MRRRDKLTKLVSYLVVFIIASVFVILFGGPNILKGYITTGIGGCVKIPILCMSPSGEIKGFKVDKEYLNTLIPHTFPKMSVSVPRGFMVVQELHKRPYYKKRVARHKESVIYVFRQGPGYFVKLFPQVKGLGIDDNYSFIKRLFSANTNNIRNISDAFFVILKSVFTPDLGDQAKVVMAPFSIKDKTGFINYNISGSEYYFDCNLVDEKGDFFKLYIKDLNATLKVEDVLTIVSTLAR